MKRAGRRLFNFAVALSLVLCLVSGALWARSLFKHEWITRVGRQETAAAQLINTSFTAIDWRESSLFLTHASWNQNFLNGVPAPAVWQFTEGESISFLPRFAVWGFQNRPTPVIPPPMAGSFAATPRAPPILQFHQWEFGLRIWVLVAIFGALPMCWMLDRFLRQQITRRRIKGKLCLACGYDLRATPDRCPECGAIPPAAKGAAV